MNGKFTLLYISGKLLTYIYAIFLAVPIYFILVTAFKSGVEVSTNPLGLPKEFSINNFIQIFYDSPLLKNSLNSIIITFSTVSLGLVNAVLVTYCIHKTFDKRIGKALYGLIVASMFIPGTGVVAFLTLMIKLGLYNNMLGVILPGALGGIAFSLFILLGFLRGLPRDMEEAATIDGCNDFQALVFVILPLIKPALFTLAIFQLVGSWNNLMGPILLLRNPDIQTIPIALLNFKGTYSVQYQLIFAGILLTSIPLVLLYFRFQKYFEEALTGSVKG
jgi:raffinose/stachyose/melibiose transport system permease protein